MSEAEQAGASRQDDGGRLLAGRYRLGGVLGRGGMGTVWRAEDETLGRTVAVKELRLPPRIDEDEKRRLITRTFREAKAIARIRNNSAVTVYDVVDEDDRPWIVMELVEGKSLAEVIREDGLLTSRRAAEVGLAILDVLRSAHREGILHRDVKPSNVLIGKDGRVVLTDFGIAQVEGDPSITSTGMLVGAPSYISPERARGHKPGPAADLWSLGGLLYAAVEGVPPYDKGSAIATLTAVMTEPVEQPKNAGPLENVIYGLLVKDPEQRLDDAGARAMLTEIVNTPEPKDEPEPVDATKVVPLPDLPSESPDRKSPSKKGTSGAGRKSEEPGDRLRGALRSVRKGKGAGAAGAAGAAAAAAGTGVAADRSAETSGGKAASASASAPASASASEAPAASASSGVAPSPSPWPSSSPPGSGSGSAGGAGSGSAGAGVPASAKNRDVSASALNSSAVGGSPGDSRPAYSRGTTSRAPLTDVVSRRALVIIAVVVALAVLGTILAVTLGGDDGSGAKENKGGDDKSTSSGANAGSDTKQDENSGTDSDDDKTDSSGGGASKESSPSASASGESSGSGGSGGGSNSGSGSGVESTHKDGQGFSIGLPKGWKYQSTSAAGSRFAGPDGQKLLVGWTTTPKDDPVADWTNQERSMRRAEYQRIRIEKVDYRGWNTADWEFTYVESGTKYRSIDRGFVVNGSQGYALMYTAKDSKWDTGLRKDTWRTLTKSFEPKS
ncbi:serine/threonine protein kinase [Streptomyces sp. NBC_00414]|uniref:serine/threonine-protein kinase n=1 Tax=Streptomyces sp. NBC_00414 TaxID=2975739 RepID=UPI002E1BE28A